ncbi:Ankyrin repeat and death domain-containing 1A [Chlorella sorokiniana]|uniref:Ankyrin repeat and death domain-containing 1A n=1 Tax=Chlorella sorokiniana TaxID=3076 RepID=A0A2P6TH92_CHLSO|nr:Ankyrin repeat and death domain-containing 1A [Chlorella sorokiniana]|eukprot:PRW33654.1 Ankyrin repeat and death domain-containing 1A [Chlorella sorokiniana]
MAEPHDAQEHQADEVTDKQEIAVRSLFSSLPLHELLAFLRMRDTRGASRVHSAAADGDSAMLGSLLAASPDQLQLADSQGRTPLAVATAHWRPEAVRLLLSQLAVRVGWAARAEAAKQALPYVLTQPPESGEQPGREAALASVVDALRNAGARPNSCATHDVALGTVPLLSAALRRRQYAVADALLQAGGASGHVAGASVQPLHALAAGLGRLSYSYQDLAPTDTVHPPRVLAVAQRLLLAGAHLDEQCTAASLYGVPGLRGATPLGYLCSVAMEVSGGAQLAALALVDMLLQAGASPSARNLAGQGPLHIAAGALYSASYGLTASPQPPFTALLHRLLQAGADTAEESTAGYTPLGKLLCCGSLVSLSQAVLDGVHALLAVGSSLAAAGGGRAWKAVLSASLTATGETEPWYAASGAAEQRRLCDDLLRTLLGAPDADLDACDHLGMSPLGHLLVGALERQLIAARDMIDYGEPLWQLRSGLSKRLRALVDQLLASGASPNALDAGQATDGADLIDATLEEDEEDDAELLTDEEEEEVAQAVAAAERERKRRRWCARRLGTRMELAAACQPPLRQSVKLHDAQLTRRLLLAGAAPGGGPGRPLMEEVLDEWGLLSHMVSLQQEERCPVLCWLFDTVEALLAAGTPPLPNRFFIEVAASWSFPWLGLVDCVLAGKQWTPAVHQAFPPTFRAAARTALLINSTRGFGRAPCQPRRSPRRIAQPSPEARSVSLPVEVLQHILSLAASPLSLWLRMMPQSDF